MEVALDYVDVEARLEEEDVDEAVLEEVVEDSVDLA